MAPNSPISSPASTLLNRHEGFRELVQITTPELRGVPFRYTYTVGYYRTPQYIAQWDGGNTSSSWLNCQPCYSDGTIIPAAEVEQAASQIASILVIFRAHSLPKGRVHVKREFALTDADFHRGVFVKTLEDDIDIELTDAPTPATCLPVQVDSTILLNMLRGYQGIQGETGKSAYQSYCEANPTYTGTEEEWGKQMAQRADVDDAMAAVATMQTEVAAATAAATAADAAATAATTAATDATTAANAATTAVATLQADVTANTAAIATNTASIAQNTTDIATNVTTIATNATDIATNTAAIAQNTTDIATNATNIATNTAAIAQHTTDIAANTASIATNTTAIANAEASITTLQTDLAAHVALYTTLKADHDALQTAHDTLQTAHDAHILLYNALKADHDALLADLTAHKALYDTLKAKVDEMEEKMITGTATGGTPLPTIP